MDGGEWEMMLAYFQASARGYLVRNEVRRARGDFEDIVTEIDGGLTHLGWSEAIIPIPYFTDAEGTFPPPPSSTCKPPRSGLDVCPRPRSPSLSAPSPQERRRSGQRTEAERDDSQTKGDASLSNEHHPNGGVRGDIEGQKESSAVDKDGGMRESPRDASAAWSSLELDKNYGHSDKGSQRYVLAQEVPCTPEALRLHRNTLTMELLWLQQAIDSRKKYLSLKNQLSVS